MSQPLALRLTEAAEGDLADIWAYIATEVSEPIAMGVLDQIRRSCQSLCRFPLAGPARDHLAPRLRVGFSGRYAIHYLHDEKELIVVRVVHGARDLATLAAQGGFGEG